ncbi:trehalose-phosphatase [soil metagenome]
MPNAERRAPDATSATDRGLTPPPVRFDRLALFLDMDGVLAPMAPTPDDVRPMARRTAILRRLDERLKGRLAIVSGRTLAEIDRISGEGSLAASGVHGLERRRGDGSTDSAAAAPGIRVATEALKAFQADHPGVIVEEKGVSVGVHYRQAPEARDAALALARSVAAETGLSVQPGIMVVELKTPGASKGSAVSAFMAESPFLGATPVMLGDDLTDEDGFEAARALGGFGVLVGPARETAARHRLDGVDAVLDWLDAVSDAAAPVQEDAA